MLLVSDHGEIIEVNKHALSILDLQRSQLKQQSLAQLCQISREQTKKELHFCARSGSPIPLALKFPQGQDYNKRIRCEGNLLYPKSDKNPPLILIRLILSSKDNNQYNVLNVEIKKQVKALKELQHSREELINEKERALVTLQSIGDGVITTDTNGIVESINTAAEMLTCWKADDAIGRPLHEIFNIINEYTRIPANNPVERCLKENTIIGLANHTVLIRKDQTEISIEDSAAPIRDQEGNIFGVVLVFHDVTQARTLAAKLTHQSTHDALTGLVNRREFEDKVQNALISASQHDLKHAMLFIDLDQFKVVNDTGGHIAGDELLRQIANLLKEPLRESDTLARLGGDEFGVLLENCKLNNAADIAREVCAIVAEYRFSWEKMVFNIGASIGVVPIIKNCGSLAELISKADIACYTAKDQGRNRIYVSDGNDEEVKQRQNEMRWVTRMRHALDNNDFLLYFQHIRPTTRKQGLLPLVEVLLRLKSQDDKDPTLPNCFIPAAERYNLMPDIDRWVLLKVFQDFEKIIQLYGPCVISINLSGATLNDDNLINYIRSLQSKFHIEPQHICFEVTETAAITNLVNTSYFMKTLKTEGYSFALDDFGSGLSSFAYLKNLPIDYLKIDGSFVRDMANNQVSLALVKSINEIGHAMDIKTVGEFIEIQDTLDKAQELGIDFAQGFFIHKPEAIRLDQKEVHT